MLRPSLARGPEPRRPAYAARITVGGAHDLAARQCETGMLGVVALERGAREPGFDAAALSTVAGRTRPFVGPEPGKRIVSPLARDAVRAQQNPAVHDDPTSDSCAEDD